MPSLNKLSKDQAITLATRMKRKAVNARAGLLGGLTRGGGLIAGGAAGYGLGRWMGANARDWDIIVAKYGGDEKSVPESESDPRTLFAGIPKDAAIAGGAILGAAFYKGKYQGIADGAAIGATAATTARYGYEAGLKAEPST